MARRLRFGALGVAALIVGILVPVLSTPANVGAATPLNVGVDHVGPSGKNWTYREFFPNQGINVHSGDVVDFQWAKVADGFHTVTPLKAGESPTDAWNNNPTFIPDADDPQPQFMGNPAVFGPSDPTCGGSAGSACAYDGSTDFNSGANGTDGTTQYFVQFNVDSGTSVNIICLLHPGMATAVNVVDGATNASTQAELDTASQTQYQADTAGALAAETAATKANQTTTNPDGTHTVEVTAGAASDKVDMLEFLPMNASVTAGDTIKYVTRGTEPHTSTFPEGTNEGEPLVGMCEGEPDTADPGTGPPCGGDFSKFEQHVNPAPGGATAIAAKDTFGTSGIIGIPGFPSGYSYSFPTSGTFNYMCHIHDNGMLGVVTVSASTSGSTTTTTTEAARAAEAVTATPTLTG